MRQQLSNLNRIRKIVQVFVRHGLLGLVDQFGLTDSALSTRPDLRGQRMAARFGRRLSLALNELGPTFVKFGQILSTREDMLPESMVRELSQLQDNTATIATTKVRAHIEDSLGAAVETLFAEFRDQPLGTGSIAQVHRARTADGTDVVVKVRRPGIERVIEEDLKLLESLAEQAAARMPEIARYDPVGFVREFGANLRQELDFRREAASLVRMRATLRSTAHVPQVFTALSTDSVLALEFIEGTKITAPAAASEQTAAARRVLACFLTQYLRSDMFHADPHAGNIVRRPNGELGLYDLGAVGCIDVAMRGQFMDLMSAAGRNDGGGMADAVLPMMHAPGTLDQASYRQDMGRFLHALISQPLSGMSASVVCRDMFAVTRQHGLRLRAEYFVLLRSLLLIDGVLRSLDPDIDLNRETRAFVVRSWFTRTWFVPASRLIATTVRAELARAWRRVWTWPVRLWRHKRWRWATLATLASAGAVLALFAVWPSAAQAPQVPIAAPPGRDAGAVVDAITADVGSSGSRRLSKNCALVPAPRREAKAVAKLSAGEVVFVLNETRYYWRVRTAKGRRGFMRKSCFATAAPGAARDAAPRR